MACYDDAERLIVFLFITAITQIITQAPPQVAPSFVILQRSVYQISVRPTQVVKVKIFRLFPPNLVSCNDFLFVVD